MALENPPTVSTTFHDVVQSCIDHLALVDLVRISTSSRQLYLLCRSELSAGNRLVAHRLLRKTVLTTAQSASTVRTPQSRRCRAPAVPQTTSNLTGTTNNSTQTVKAVEWLLQIAGKEHLLQHVDSNPLATETIAIILQAGSSVPLDLAETLVSAGLRVTYPQLFSAACNSPRGLSVWVKAHQRLHIPIGIPSYLASICCGWSISQDRLPVSVTAPQLADALFLAIATAKSQLSLSRISHMCRHPAAADITPDALAKLLHAAVVKQCSFSGSGSNSSTGNLGQSQQPQQQQQQQQQDEDQLLPQGLLAYQPHECMITSLCSIPATNQITTAQAAAVLRVAAEVADASLLHLLCTELLTAVRYLSTELLSDIFLCIAAKYKYQTAMVAKLCDPLCALPAMQQVSKHAVADLIREMIHYNATGIVHALCGLPRAKRLSNHVVGLLVELAWSAWGASCSCSTNEDDVCITDLQTLASVCGCL